jgi:hypothetical protein
VAAPILIQRETALPCCLLLINVVVPPSHGAGPHNKMQGVTSKLLPRILVTSPGGISPSSGCEPGKLFIPSPSVYNCTNTIQVQFNYILAVAGVRELFTHTCV